MQNQTPNQRPVNIILCHNHPSGELRPSAEDKDITDRLIQVGIIVNTAVLDHLIISEKSYLSFADNGIMYELQKSTKYVPTYVIEQRIRKEAKELAEQKRSVEIAKTMKRANEPIDKIAAFTGLSVEEIEKLRVRKK